MAVVRKAQDKQSGSEWWKATATLDDALSRGLTEKEFNSLLAALGRSLNMVELGICSALFSEHCSYKSTKLHLKNLPTSGPKVLQGPGENAGVIDIGDGQAVVFKVESHNHPTFIEPFQGAATGVGGILRDVFTMGARPLALMNGLRFGTADHIKTPYLLSRAVKGIGAYGNCMGIPTVGGELCFDAAYNGNCLVNAFALGLVDSDKIFLGHAAGVGNKVMYVGSKTGRDGIHGATMASDVFDEDSAEKRPTVQVGDPFQEKLLLEACLEIMASGAVVGIQDMGAAGLTSSTYEMADRAGTGVRVHLDRVPQRETGMNPYELMLSESQERMLVVVEKGREGEIKKIFDHWELDSVIIGEVIEGKDVELYWHDELISAMPAAVLTSAVPQLRWPESAPADYEARIASKGSVEFDGADSSFSALSKDWLELVSSVNLCSRRPVYNQYDSTVRSNTVIHPGSDAGVIRVKAPGSQREKGVAMKLDCNSRYCLIDPHLGTALSVAEAVRNISAVGAEPIGISDCLNFGSPERAEGMWEIAESIRGLGDAARAFNIPIVSGNVSLYNETLGRAILPTPMIAMVGLISDARKSIGAHFKHEGDLILVLGATNPDELGGSEYLFFKRGVNRGALPVLSYDLEARSAKLVRDLIAQGLLSSCHDVSQGGLAVALAEACFSPYSAIGAVLDLGVVSGLAQGIMFAESSARYVLSCSPAKQSIVRELAEQAGVPVSASGKVGGAKIKFGELAELDLKTSYNAWASGLNRLFGR